MKNEITINVRRFPVLAHDHRAGQEKTITVTVTKEQLRAAQIVGQSGLELVGRILDRQGYTAIEIRKPTKRTITLDLDKLLERYDLEQDERAKRNYINGIDGEAGS